MSDSPQQTQDFQAMINTAVEAFMDDHKFRLTSTQVMGMTPQDADDITGSEAPSKDLQSLLKRQRVGLTGKAPAKRRKYTSRLELPPPVVSSEEDEAYPQNLDIIDEWRANALECSLLRVETRHRILCGGFFFTGHTWILPNGM
ncbi:Hypothetical predicted protein [Pelobates cultripes]|uniref:Uncharacterized protein n=1 Tax=Pelobates cultripes TaxID=61616 RepID=A0AAD1S6I7_PELCU|nr:Hypothetical predicted protein [Pelobates cultripes]